MTFCKSAPSLPPSALFPGQLWTQTNQEGKPTIITAVCVRVSCEAEFWQPIVTQMDIYRWPYWEFITSTRGHTVEIILSAEHSKTLYYGLLWQTHNHLSLLGSMVLRHVQQHCHLLFRSAPALTFLKKGSKRVLQLSPWKNHLKNPLWKGLWMEPERVIWKTLSILDKTFF